MTTIQQQERAYYISGHTKSGKYVTSSIGDYEFALDTFLSSYPRFNGSAELRLVPIRRVAGGCIVCNNKYVKELDIESYRDVKELIELSKEIEIRKQTNRG